MKLRALSGIAVAALACVAALAFENTSWYGNLECTVKAKVLGERAENQAEVAENVGLNTTDTTFALGPIAGSNCEGLIIKRTARSYKAAQPATDPDLTDFTNWVKAKILARTGLDVDLATVEMKGGFNLLSNFTLVRTGLKIKWTGTVATGEHAGKAVRGSIRLKGTLPRD